MMLPSKTPVLSSTVATSRELLLNIQGVDSVAKEMNYQLKNL